MIVLSLSVTSCGDNQRDGRVKVGSFTIALPPGARQVHPKALGAGKVMITHGALTVIAEPMGTPTEADPGEPSACLAHGRALAARGLSVTDSKVTTLALGKACLVDSHATLSSGRVGWSRQVNLRVGEHGLVVQCSSDGPAQLDDCATLFGGIALAPGVKAPPPVAAAAVTPALPAPPPAAPTAAAPVPAPAPALAPTSAAESTRPSAPRPVRRAPTRPAPSAPPAGDDTY